jgi:hypothetical protein
MPASRPTGPSLALAAYAESLIAGHRILVFGDACSPLVDALLERGARLVHVCDPDPARVAEGATRNTSSDVSYAPLGEGGLGLREGTFELAVVENLAALGSNETLLKRLKRALSARGVALIASPNPDCRVRLLPGSISGPGPDYYALYDLVASEFEHVRMVGQTPFVGYTVVDFAPDQEPEPTFDTSYLRSGSQEPEWFIALASQHPATLGDFLVVELPAEQVLGETRTRGLEQQIRQARDDELRSRERIVQLESQLERRPAHPPRADDRVPHLQAELDKRDRWIQALEARADTADARADAAESELEALREREQGALRESELAAQRVQELEYALTLEKAKLEQELVAETAKRDQEREAERVQSEHWVREKEDHLRAEFEQESLAEVMKLEQQLAERGREIQRLERQLAEAQRAGRDLVTELEATKAAYPVLEALKAQLEQLAQLNAEREGELAAAQWSIQSLENELGRIRESTGDAD